MNALSAVLSNVVAGAGRLRSNSAAIEPGDWFIATGADDKVAAHVAESIRRGARGVLVDCPTLPPHDLVHQLPGLRESLGAVMAQLTHHASREMTLVGVTGTNGKTSTVQLLAQAWERLGVVGATIGTLGAGLHNDLEPTGLTTPPVVELHGYLADFHHDRASCVAIEVSSHALEQGRVEGCEFRVVAISNITRDHLDYHHTMHRYAAAKNRILQLPGVTTAVLNLDDPLVAQMQPPPGTTRIGVSTRDATGALVTAHDIAADDAGTRFTLRIGDESAPVATGLSGRFQVDNLTLAAGILHAQGHAVDEIAAALSASVPVAGRMQVTPATPSRPRVVIDYAHTPDALSQAVAACRPHGDGRLIVVFGCTGNRDRGKRPLMAAATGGADFIILTDDDTHDEDGDAIIVETIPGFANPETVVIIRDRRRAVLIAIHMAHPQDVVLIAGKGHETTQSSAGHLIPSDDTRYAERALSTRPLRPPG
ncbi:Mur ligase family protein [Microbacterium radiodurans]|nr:UDP-N-acetylmuramoyl-L-alanyl-D-glutamate--2,6-diaminopimelate ligase [Microbacterium radiodurans]